MIASYFILKIQDSEIEKFAQKRQLVDQAYSKAEQRKHRLPPFCCILIHTLIGSKGPSFLYFTDLHVAQIRDDELRKELHEAEVRRRLGIMRSKIIKLMSITYLLGATCTMRDQLQCGPISSAERNTAGKRGCCCIGVEGILSNGSNAQFINGEWKLLYSLLLI